MKRAAIALTLVGCSGGAATSPPTAPAPAAPVPTVMPDAAPALTATDAMTPDASTAERRYLVYDGTELILELSSQPGIIRSTAHAPGPPARHPFLSARARSAVHEDRLRQLLVASKSFDELVAALQGAGFRLEPTAP